MRFHRRLSASDHKVRRAGHGFTLIELMITIAIMAVLLTVASPSFLNVVLGNRLNSSANNLVASATLARSEAIKRNKQMRMCVSSNGTTCTAGGWEQGWIVTCKTTNNIDCDGVGPDWLVLRHQAAADGGLRITDTNPGAVTSISFDPSGVGATQASLKVCRETPSVGSQERMVTITATGRAYATRTSTGTCP